MAVKCVMLEYFESLTILRDSPFLHKFHNYLNTRVILKLAVKRHWYDIKKNFTPPSSFSVSSYTTTIVFMIYKVIVTVMQVVYTGLLTSYE